MNQVMQAMEAEGKTPARTPKFWKAISERMDRTRTRDQCRDKWKVKDGRIRWRETDTKILVNKYVWSVALRFTLTARPESRF